MAEGIEPRIEPGPGSRADWDDVAQPVPKLGIEGLSDYRRIGSGGFATVYSALEAAAGRRVAVKVLAAVDSGGRRRFDRECLTMGTAGDHPNVVTLLRAGYLGDGGTPYLVMEYMAAGSLAGRLAMGPMGWKEAIGLVVPIASALGFSHRSGILHKDVKPANILVSRAGVVKLSDFGIAAIREAGGTSQVAYSINYTSPESFEIIRDEATGELIDPRDERSDLYSLATTLYALGAGRPPFQGTTPVVLMHQILTAPVPPTGIDQLDAFFARALAKQPDQRPSTAAEFIAEVSAVAASLPGAPAPAPASSPTAIASSTPPGTSASRSTGTHGFSHGSAHPDTAVQNITSWQPDEVRPVASAPVSSAPVGSAGVGAAHGGIDAVGAAHGGIDAVGIDDDGVAWEPAPTGAVPVVAGRLTAGSTAPDRSRGRVWRPASGRRWVPLVVAFAAMAIGGGVAIALSTGGGGGLPQPIVYAGHRELAGPSGDGAVHEVALLDDGRFASSSADGTVQLWDPDQPSTMPARYTGHRDLADNPEVDAVYTVIQLADGRMASAGVDGTIQIWDPDEPSTTVASYTGHRDLAGDPADHAVYAMGQLADGRVASADDDGTVQIWDPADPGAPAAVYTAHRDLATSSQNDAVWSIALLGNGRIASGSADGTVHVWDPDQPGQPPSAIYTGHRDLAGDPGDDVVRAIAELDDGRIASGSADGTVQVWDPARPTDPAITYTGHRLAAADRDNDTVRAIAVLDDGRIASGGADGSVHVWDPSRPTDPSGLYTGHTSTVNDLFVLANQRVVSASEDGTVQIWDPTTLQG